MAMEDCKDLVSVIVPIYNMEKYLDRCVQSILRQTYTNLEILLIDDGSTDRSLQLMKQYAEQDQRVHVYHKENGGVSSARNLGLEKMHGEYCTFIDPDDYVADVYVEWLYAAVRKAESKLVVGSAIPVQPDDKDIFKNLNKGPTIHCIDLDRYSLWGEGARTACWGVLYEKNVVSDLYFNEGIFNSEDTLFFISVLSKCEKIAIVCDSIYAYVQNLTSVRHTGYTPKKWTEIDAWQTILGLGSKLPQKLFQSIQSWYVIICIGVLMQLLHSKYRDLDKVKYLIRELRKYRKAIVYIPKEKKSLRIRASAAVVFPRLTSHFMWYHYQHKDE